MVQRDFNKLPIFIKCPYCPERMTRQGIFGHIGAIHKKHINDAMPLLRKKYKIEVII